MLFSKLRVRVRDGVALLIGVVGSVRARCSAEQDARNVAGVWKVRSLLAVNTSRFFSDGAIRRAIVKALASDRHVGSFEFNVNVRRGRVYLYGRVSSHFESQRVGEIAAAVKGVVEVDNQAELLEPTDRPRRWLCPPSADVLHLQVCPHADHVLTMRIRQRWLCSANLHGQNMEVQVKKGRVTLTGTVDTWLEREEAILDAYEAGACEVTDQLCTLGFF